MDTPSRPFDAFLRRVHRRQVAVRLIERIGLGILGGCAAALPLLSIAIWRGLETVPLAIAAVSLGAMAGVVWGIVSRPRILASAMEADEQFQWDDLLSSAWTLRHRPTDEPWVGMVLDLADERTRKALPSALVLNRLGARTWGGIGLATALVIVLTLLPTYAVPTQAGGNVELVRQMNSPEAVSDANALFSSGKGVPRSVVQQDPDELTGNPALAQEEAVSGSFGQNHQSLESDARPGADSLRQNGTGTGASHSNSPDRTALAAPRDASIGAKADAGGNTSSGTGESTGASSGKSHGSGSIAGSSSHPQHIPPWQSPTWQSDSQAAQSAVEGGRVPAAYGDIVRQYFDRSEQSSVP